MAREQDLVMIWKEITLARDFDFLTGAWDLTRYSWK
jgi:hypothetical protein